MLDYITLTPSFPEFQGPLAVGSSLVEIPVSEIDSPVPAQREGISTIKVRIFYPTSLKDTSKSKPIWWLQDPQSQTLGAYSKYVGAGNLLARLIGLIPAYIKRTKIPAIADAPLLDAESSNGTSTWPVVIFSHGIAGSCNAYSYLCGSIASCGTIVFAVEHRDGSAPISLVHLPDGSVKATPYQRYEHEPTPEILDSRNAQLRTRMTELDMLYSVVEQMNEGVSFTNLLASKKSKPSMPSFTSKLDIRPSKVIWVGHSFGAATMVQFLKSIYWGRTLPESDNDSDPGRFLYKLASNSRLQKQVTSKSPLVLLDLWTMPLRGDKAAWLYEQPLPCFDDKNPTSSTVLSVMSEEFFETYPDLRDRTKYILSGKPDKTGIKLVEEPGHQQHWPRLFYVNNSAHLNQSDFGILFPSMNRRSNGVIGPERIMNLNLRAIVQFLRENSVPVTPIKVMQDDDHATSSKLTSNDEAIFADSSEVKNWTTIPLRS